MKILAISGSPRAKGNTNLLLETMFAEFEKQGFECELVNVGVKPVRGCMACYKCREMQNRQCIIKDDIVNSVVQKMIEADGIILASPVYYAGMSGELKSFIDRAFFVCGANGALLKYKVGASLAVARRAGSVATLDSLNHYFLISGMSVVGSTYWPMGFGFEKGETWQDLEGVETAKNMAINMAWVIKALDAEKATRPVIVKNDWTNFIR